jgi:exopolyphosphatase/guanosine-5'-triphosphate,3'-diphosphate pyrophosphatase
VHELAYRYNWEERHAQHAAATSTFLFDVCRPIYEGPDGDAELLEYATLLHDVGHLVSHDTHAKHSRYLIKNANLQGFQPDEIAVMSLVARYHRGRAPKSSDKHYRKQSGKVQRRIRQLASLVRIAEGLDRSHFQNVTALRARLTDEALELSIATKGDPQLEVWSGGEEGAMFEDEFGRELRVTPTTIDVEAGDETDPSVSHATVSAPEAVN